MRNLTLLLLFAASFLPFAWAQTAEDDRLLYLPGFGAIEEPEKQYAGYLDVNTQQQTALFYWYFAHQNLQAPVIVWINGGPGCSSISAGLFEELGPYRIVNRTLLAKNEHSWTQEGHLVFIDQPVGTGFSVVPMGQGYTTNQDEVSNDFYTALQNFFNKFPALKSNPLFIAGESYAGKYIPAIAEKIIKENEKLQPADPKHLNLKAIAIGNGIVEPIIQRPLVLEQAYYAGLIGYEQREQLSTMVSMCSAWMQAGNTIERGTPCSLMNNQYLTTASGGIDLYDLRKYTNPEKRTELLAYLNSRDVQEALHVVRQLGTTKEFVSCNRNVSDSMKNDILVSTKYRVKYLMSKLKILLYAGNFDLKDGAQGIEQYLLTMNIAGFKEAPRNLWIVNGKTAGYVKTIPNLTFLTIHGSGHFVPGDQPENSLDMIRRLVNDQPFCGSKDRIMASKLLQQDPDLFSTLSLWFVDSAQQSISCDVSQNLCVSVFNNCFQHGKCVNGACQCEKGYTGSTCAYSQKSFSVATADTVDLLSYQGWMYYDLPTTNYKGKTIKVLLVSQSKTKYEVPADPLEDKFVGEGLGTPGPAKKICIYGRAGAPPTTLQYDFVQCDLRADAQVLALAYIQQSTENLHIGIYNSLPVEVSYKVSADVFQDATALSIFHSWPFWVLVSGTFIVVIASITLLVACAVSLRQSNKKYQELTKQKDIDYSNFE